MKFITKYTYKSVFDSYRKKEESFYLLDKQYVFGSDSRVKILLLRVLHAVIIVIAISLYMLIHHNIIIDMLYNANIDIFTMYKVLLYTFIFVIYIKGANCIYDILVSKIIPEIFNEIKGYDS